MSGIKRRTELNRRRFMTGVSLSFSISSYSAVEADCDVLPFSPFFDAPYPAFSTAAIISAGEAVPSTPMEFVRRLTAQDVTPGTFDTAFSTRVWQAAQLMPVTLYCSIVCLPFCSSGFSISYTLMGYLVFFYTIYPVRVFCKCFFKKFPLLFCHPPHNPAGPSSEIP